MSERPGQLDAPGRLLILGVLGSAGNMGCGGSCAQIEALRGKGKSRKVGPEARTDPVDCSFSFVGFLKPKKLTRALACFKVVVLQHGRSCVSYASWKFSAMDVKGLSMASQGRRATSSRPSHPSTLCRQAGPIPWEGEPKARRFHSESRAAPVRGFFEAKQRESFRVQRR